MGNQEILNRAVEALNRNLIHEKATIDYEGNLPYLTVLGKRFVCMIEPNLTLGKLVDKIPDYYKQPDKNIRYLFITINATPKMLEVARLPDINVLDCAGNFNIQYQLKNGKTVLMLVNKGEKPIEDTTAKAYPIFTEKGIGLIFYLLLDKHNIMRSYREIAEATGVAVGTVKNIIDGLIDRQFVRVENKKRYLIRTERLLKLWSGYFDQTLKPKLLQTRFAFRDREKRNNWQDIILPEGMVYGGEPAAALTNGYLTPGEFTIYTSISPANLMKTGAVVPDQNGDISVYQKFWKSEGESMAAPAIVIYADLLESANSRCIEAAQKILENELEYLL